MSEDAAQQIVIVGLGPGSLDQLTGEARALLTRGGPVFVRTQRHPVVTALEGVTWQPFDVLYDTAADFDSLQTAIVERLRAALAAATHPIIYAVPGHPLYGDATVQAVLAAGLPVRLVAGLSLTDAAAAALQRDPVAEQWQLIDALALARVTEAAPFAGGTMPYTPQRPALVCQLAHPRLASAVKIALMRLLPDDYVVSLVHGEQGARQDLPLYALDRPGTTIDHLTCLYIPAQSPLAALRTPETLAYITARLRAPGGCPWDREQTHRSLLPHVVEEAYEVVEAIERDDPAALGEELGDLLLQVVLHAQLAEEEGTFLLEDVLESISAKLIRRHPHVFGDVSVSGSGEVLRNWDQIKAAERQAKGLPETTVESVFSGIPRALPALSRAQTFQRRAARAGYASPPAAELAAATAQEMANLLNAAGPEERQRHTGELLLSLAALAGQLGVDAETALRAAVDRFQQDVEVAARATAPHDTDLST